MSNKTQLQANNAALDSYIARINAAKDTAASLPEADSPEAGGGSTSGFESNTEVCVISIDSDYIIQGVGYYSTEGHIVYSGTSSVQISAICGSVVYVAQDGLYSVNVSSGEILYKQDGIGFTYRVPSASTTVTINITTD